MILYQENKHDRAATNPPILLAHNWVGHPIASRVLRGAIPKPGLVAMEKRKLQVMSVTRSKSARRCLRHCFYAHEERVRPVAKADSLVKGSAIHIALETWWGAPSNADRWGDVERWFENPTTRDGEVVELEPYTRAYCWALMAGYHARWGQQELEVLGVEKRFDIPLRNPETGAESRIWRVGGDLDALVRNPIAEEWVVEHKTSSDDITPGSDYWRQLRLDAQVSTYLEGAKSFGYAPMGVLYDVIGKPDCRPLKATPEESRKYTKKTGELYANQRATDETPDEYRDRVLGKIAEDPNRYYQRADVVRLESEAEEAAADLWQTAQMIREAQRLGRWPRNPDACFNYHQACEYFGVCTKQELLSDARFVRVERKEEGCPKAA